MCIRTACRRAAILVVLLLTSQLPLASEKPDFLTVNIDPSVHPGDDFYQYSVGAWLKRNPIPPTEANWGVGDVVREQLYATLRAIHERAAEAQAPAGSDEQKIGDFWRTATDVEKASKLGVAPLWRELAQINAAKNLKQAIDVAFFMQTLGIDPFFSLFLDQDRKESDVFSVYVWQGGLGLPDRDFYIKDEKSIRQTRAEYGKYLARLLRLLGRSEVDAGTAAGAVLRFETALAKVSRKLEDLRDPLKNYHRLAPAEFTRLHTPSVNWSAQLGAWNFRPEYVVVGQPEYFSALDRLLRQTPLAVLKDYLRIRLISAAAPYLSPAFDDANFDFYGRVLSGQKEQRPRWKRVLDTEFGFGAVPEGIGMMVARRYVTENFPERAKKRYADMTRAFIDAYGERIKKLSWMSETTKARALEKLAAINAKVGYPDRWQDHAALVIGGASYCENMMAIEQWRFKTQLERFGKPVDRTEWRMTPQTYNAYHNWSNNEIVLPAAVFAIPGVADEEVDDAVAYAYAGAATIGHEITHGFDDQGRKFDAKGNLADWWTAADAAAFEKRAAVVVKQFDAYEPLPGFRINGKASLGENLADLGGLAIALDAFKKTEQYRNNVIIGGQTPLQRFFLGFGLGWLDQMREETLRRRLLSNFHAPPKWRVLGPVSNVPEFYEAFEVTAGRKMWRDVSERASVW
jgi:putative endopeptidase